MQRTKLGMVIINYNDAKTTIELLENIKDYKCLDSIIVVDNKSTDDSVKRLKKYQNTKIELIEAHENKGYASGLNIGAKYLNKKYKNCNIIFSNADIIIAKEEDLERLNQDITDDIVVVGPTIIERTGINRGWKLPTAKDEIRFNLPILGDKFRAKNTYPEEHYQKDLSFVDVVAGCIFCVKGSILEKIDYFDENTFLYYEEQILSKKLIDINKKIAIDNTVKVIHNHSVTIDKNIARIRKYKILKTSQRYYVKEYLKASKWDLFRLEFNRRLFLTLLYIVCFFKGGKNN